MLLTGQRRMGKTSILRELGRRLDADGWIFLFVDVEGATCAEDAIADVARAVHPVRPVASRFALDMKRWVSENIDEISAFDFGVKIRAGLDAGSWRHHGEALFVSAPHRNNQFSSSSTNCRSSSNACSTTTVTLAGPTNS